MKLIVFAMVLALLAAVSCSEYQPTSPALSENEAKPASSTSSEESDEDNSDEEKTVHQPPVVSYNAPVVSYVQQTEYKIPYVVPSTAAPEYVAPVSSDYDPALTILPYWLRPRTY